MAGRDRINEPVFQELWSVVIPRVGCSEESPKFQLDGQFWNFKLETTVWNRCDESWNMRLIKKESGGYFQSFLVRAYVRDVTGDLYMAHKEISSTNTVIWSYSRSAFSASYPSIQVTAVLHFSFRIVPLRKVSQRLANKHKSTQTSVYKNDSLCLESLSLDLRKLMEDGQNPDVQLKCGDRIVPAHRLILGARSEVFRAMLQSDMLEGRGGSVEIVDMEPKIFELFIRYLYTGILPELTEDTAAPLYEAGDKYRSEALKFRCGDFLADNLTLENACGLLVMVDAHSDPLLKDRIASYIINRKVPDSDVEWQKFCAGHPRLAVEVLNRAWKSTSSVA